MRRGGSYRGRRGNNRNWRGDHKGNREENEKTNDQDCSGSRPRGRGRGKHPAGLSGRDIGLWYAKKSKEKIKQREIENRSVVTLHKEHEEELKMLLQDTDTAGSSLSSSANRNIQGSSDEDWEMSSCSATSDQSNSYYGSMLKDFDSILEDTDAVQPENTRAGIFINKPALKYAGEHSCTLKCDSELEEKLVKEQQTKQELKTYTNMLEFRKKLPSYQMQKDILEKITQNQVCVISGETGCGKTTQVAQFILDDCIARGEATTCHIICTQPRRISAVSVAERVADERGESLGKSCGYQIRLENKQPRKQASILYCTTGILLQRLVNDPYLQQISHIILDEIHERDLHSDFLLIIIRDLIPHRRDLKVVLMSATLNAEMFSRYFGDCPMLHIPGFTFPVKEYFLEDVFGLVSYRPCIADVGNRRVIYGRQRHQQEAERRHFLDYLHSVQKSYSHDVLEALENMDYEEIDNDLVLSIIHYICCSLGEGAILIFVPGWAQISKLHDCLMKHPVYRTDRFIVIPLHSQMPTANQRQIFNVPPSGRRKIVISTNIAETSITIPDVVFVIDCGKTKENTYDVETDVCGLQPVWVSKASAKQRKGRAGRVQEGYCFHLFTKYHWDSFKDYSSPEMSRTPLDTLGLQIKILRLGKMQEFLQKAMEPPSEKAILNAIKTLKRMRAFDEFENLTPLGYHLARIPVAPKVGRMILFSAMFSCLDPVLTVAASLDFKEPFYIPLHQEKKADYKRRELAEGAHSDHIMIVNAFKRWEEARENFSARQYCWEYFLSENILKMIENMKKQFARLLYEIGFLSSTHVKDGKANRLSGNRRLVTAVICAGLYPNVVKVEYGNKIPKFSSAQHGRVHIHPKSVNEQIRRFESPWLIYHELLRTIKLYVRDCSVVTPFALLFFGGELKVFQEEGRDTISVDDVIKFHSPEKIATLVKKLRKELDVLLNKKIEYPSMQLVAGCSNGSSNDRILATIIEMITREEVKSKSSTGYR